LFFGFGEAAPLAPPPVVTYRTVCVRLCDGSFFPISYATTSDRFSRDEKACQKSCSSPAKLYVYRSSGGTPETMVDRNGQPYAQLATAFRYRTAYDASCTCKPQPWEEAAQERHRMYALAAAKKRGDKRAALELAQLKAAADEKVALAKKVAATREAPDDLIQVASEAKAPVVASWQKMSLGAAPKSAAVAEKGARSGRQPPSAHDEFQKNFYR
jgi:hypothetical protein